MHYGDAAGSGQFGLLDLSVDLSVPEVYSGTDFTLYLHVKNPFASRIWIRSVELSLPTQLKWRPTAKFNEQVTTQKRWWRRRPLTNDERRIRAIEQRIVDLMSERSKLGSGNGRRERRISRDLSEQYGMLQRLQLKGASWIEANANAAVHIENAETRGGVILKADPGSTIYIGKLNAGSDVPERVPLQGSLPSGAALEPGCTDVWTIRLGSGWSPFFIPAQYKLQMTVVYSATPPRSEISGSGHTVNTDSSKSQETDDVEGRTGQRGVEAGHGSLYSNTTSSTVQVKAALWAVIAGGVLGGVIGSAGRSLQDATSFDVLFGARLGAALGALVLAVILSGAGIVFAARKSNAQAFISVEDFWGGLLVGFLIGYSGTAAFSNITGVPT
ncbi:hypothetical protein [Nocardia sp. NPDC057272]|uniref:hypothetical protein n=1 Tax=Nocardia sp. NPDC057272 TaxID=3346079 RepID=UPI00362F2B23